MVLCRKICEQRKRLGLIYRSLVDSKEETGVTTSITLLQNGTRMKMRNIAKLSFESTARDEGKAPAGASVANSSNAVLRYGVYE